MSCLCDTCAYKDALDENKQPVCILKATRCVKYKEKKEDEK